MAGNNSVSLRIKIMNTSLGNVVVLDVEGKVFVATVNGRTQKSYTFAQILACQHLIDNPGFDSAAEKAHFSKKPISGRDRGAQPFTEDEINLYIANVAALGRKHYHLPGGMAKRVMKTTDEGYIQKDSCLAWWEYCNQTPNIMDKVRLLRPITERDERRNIKLNEVREDSCYRVDSDASRKYKNCEDVELVREILFRAFPFISEAAKAKSEFHIRILKSGKRKDKVEFNPATVMPLAVVALDVNGKWRRDSRGNPVGVRAIISGVLQHHAMKSGKGSKASARAKTRGRLKRAEQNYRKAHGIPEVKGTFPAPIPEVRKHHEKMNKELVRIFRDFSGE
jgi:hypothetical protein